MVWLDEVTDLMEDMMKLEIFSPSEKLRMVKDNDTSLLDPNLIMDARHEIFRENFAASPTKCFVLTEAKRLLTQEETRKLRLKREQEFLEKELKKFERNLQKSRPKFRGPYTCSKKCIADSSDEDFWRTSKRIKDKRNILEQITEKNHNIHETSVCVDQSITEGRAIEDSSRNVENRRNSIIKVDAPRVGGIKVTITDKVYVESQDQRLHILRKYFLVLKRNAEEQKRFRDIKMRIQQNVILKMMRKYFDLWRAYTKNARKVMQKQSEEQETSDERKIELFINAITERQKELMKDRKSKHVDANSIVENPRNVEIKKKNICPKHIIVESPAQSRLNAQKRIIEKQRAKLAEQNRIIEELKLKQTQEEISKAGKETVNAAKETLTHCGRETRRTLIQLMRQAGYRDKSITVAERPLDPPKFLLRMEARAQARRERIKLSEETRRKKLEEQKRKEEEARIEEEQKKRRLQQEALREARRLRKEQEQHRLREIERFKKLNELAEEFYRKYLLRRYLIEPLITLVEMKYNYIEKAAQHYKLNTTKKVFMAWKKETENQNKLKSEIATMHYHRSLMTSVFTNWKRTLEEGKLQRQVAGDFYDMKLLDKCFKSWRTEVVALKAEYEKKAELSKKYYENKLKSRCFERWKKFPAIAAQIKESEKRKEELRRIVQTVIPDFDPKERGVAIED